MLLTIDKMETKTGTGTICVGKKKGSVPEHRAFEVYGNCYSNHKGQSCYPALQRKQHNQTNYTKTS
jgi:hypothetical protein